MGLTARRMGYCNYRIPCHFEQGPRFNGFNPGDDNVMTYLKVTILTVFPSEDLAATINLSDFDDFLRNILKGLCHEFSASLLTAIICICIAKNVKIMTHFISNCYVSALKL